MDGQYWDYDKARWVPFAAEPPVAPQPETEVDVPSQRAGLATAEEADVRSG